MPAWVIEVSGITDPKNSDNVQVEIFRATDHVTRDANGDVRKDMSFTTDPDARSHNILHGHIKDGVLVTDESDIHLLADPFLMPEFHWTHARLKLRLEPDGSMKGILGGYHDWYALYWSYASSGWVEEHSTSLDMPAFWYSLKRNADADPDPKTGENKSISTAYEVEAVPRVRDPYRREERQEGFGRGKRGGAQADRGECRRMAEGPGMVMSGSPRRRVFGVLCFAAAGLIGLGLAGCGQKDDAPATKGGPVSLRRLTEPEYRQIIADVFGATIKVPGRFEPDIRENGLIAVGTARESVAGAGLEEYDLTARGIADQVVDETHRTTLIPCKPATETGRDDACAGRFPRRRRPSAVSPSDDRDGTADPGEGRGGFG